MCVLNICINCPKFFRTHCIAILDNTGITHLDFLSDNDTNHDIPMEAILLSDLSTHLRVTCMDTFLSLKIEDTFSTRRLKKRYISFIYQAS